MHDYHPVLKERLSPDDKCWKTEEAVIVEECDLCTGLRISNDIFGLTENNLRFLTIPAEEIAKENPIVCVAKGYKELVECKKSHRTTYRR